MLPRLPHRHCRSTRALSNLPARWHRRRQGPGQTHTRLAAGRCAPGGWPSQATAPAPHRPSPTLSSSRSARSRCGRCGNQAHGQPEHTPSAASVPVWATLQPRVMHASSRWARGGRARAPRNIAVAGASLPLGLHTNLPGSGQALALLPGTGSGAPGTELEPSRGAGEISPICPSGSRGDPGQPPA